MPSFAGVSEFVELARNVNPHFERRKPSALHALIALLKSESCTQLKIIAALAAIPAAKLRKYETAIQFLQQTHPGLRRTLALAALEESNAAKFERAALPAGYNPNNNQGKEIMVGTPPSGFLNETCEQFLLNSTDINGIILIHLCKAQKPMMNVFAGKTVLEHLNSVLHTAKLLNVPVCALHMIEHVPVCLLLKRAYEQVPTRVPVFRPLGHIGSANAAFRGFAASKTNCVVMGFDGTICVHANMFGGPEARDDNQGFAPPLISLTNVVTSRAVLVNEGQLYSKNPNQKPYGVLDGT